MLCESTYGDRDHPSDPPADQALADTINRVAKRGGVIVVPAFAVDRTQLLLYYVRKLEDVEAEAIRFALAHYRGQMSKMARKLGIGRSTLYRKMKDIGVEAAEAVDDVDDAAA